jgi:FkbM family methyltransferase
MRLKRLAYRFLPKTLVNELRHRKHVRDLATAVEPEEARIKPFILPGYTVFDIGANFGVFTKLFSRLVGPQGLVIAFEPVPQTFRTLATGVQRLHLRNVQAVNKAVSDQVGTALMRVPQYAGGKGENLYESRIISAANSQDAFSVDTITVDSLQISRVDFIKIDVEGHELEVLRGSVETLKRFRPTLMVEITSPAAAEFLCDEMKYDQPVIISPSNQLFTSRLT